MYNKTTSFFKHDKLTDKKLERGHDSNSQSSQQKYLFVALTCYEQIAVTSNVTFVMFIPSHIDNNYTLTIYVTRVTYHTSINSMRSTPPLPLPSRFQYSFFSVRTVSVVDVTLAMSSCRCAIDMCFSTTVSRQQPGWSSPFQPHPNPTLTASTVWPRTSSTLLLHLCMVNYCKSRLVSSRRHDVNTISLFFMLENYRLVDVQPATSRQNTSR